MSMTGRRVYRTEGGCLYFGPGDYGEVSPGVWWARPPIGSVANLADHEVVEHEDGTITVTPSIQTNNTTDQWHGYLTRGVWTDA